MNEKPIGELLGLERAPIATRLFPVVFARYDDQLSVASRYEPDTGELFNTFSVGLRSTIIDTAAHRSFLLASRLKLWTTWRPPFSPGKISMLSMLFATLSLLSECAGLGATRDMLVTIRGPQVIGLRLVRLKVAAMDQLLRFVLELQHQVA